MSAISFVSACFSPFASRSYAFKLVLILIFKFCRGAGKAAQKAMGSRSFASAAITNLAARNGGNAGAGSASFYAVFSTPTNRLMGRVGSRRASTAPASTTNRASKRGTGNGATQGRGVGAGAGGNGGAV